MATNFDSILHNQFPQFGEVFQSELGTPIGYTRKTVSVTGTAGQKLYIGDILIDNGDGTVTIPANIAAITTAISGGKTLAIYAGNDAHQNVNTANPTYNHNVTDFYTGALTQKVVVVYRGIIGVARGGVIDATDGRANAGLRFPTSTTTAQMKTVREQLEKQGIHVLRQVPTA